jgi:heptosyltransferase II
VTIGQKILVVQTAFIGDVVLTTPLLDALHQQYPDAEIDIVVTPAAAALLQNHPSLHEVMAYDKRGRDSGLMGIFAMYRRLRARTYDIAILPHRSFRSGMIAFSARRRIAFSTSSARMLMTDIVEYQPLSHEVERILSLLGPLKISIPHGALPSLYPSAQDSEVVSEILDRHTIPQGDRLIALAPGSVWATKRWLADRFAELAKELIKEDYSVVLIGGAGDRDLARALEMSVGSRRLLNTVDKLSLLQSAELIRRCRLLVSNDSAPLHIAVAMHTTVVAIFGATAPEFGFAPLGSRDKVVQIQGLDCRPCAIHGGDRCPITTFDCMKNIQVSDVVHEVHSILHATEIPIA